MTVGAFIGPIVRLLAAGAPIKALAVNYALLFVQGRLCRWEQSC